MLLLGYFKEARAHKPIIRLFSLPISTVDALFGQMITENLPHLLFETCGGELDWIRAMARDEAVDEFCRNSALQA